MSSPHVHKWQALSPSDETGVAFACYGEGTCPEGNAMWSPSPVCKCDPHIQDQWPAERCTTCTRRIEPS